MGVTIDKSRGNTIVEGVSVKSITEGGSAALAKSTRGVGLKLGMYNVVDMVLVYTKSHVNDSVTETSDTRVQKFHTNGGGTVKVFTLADVFYTPGVCYIRGYVC